ncbi:gliding motility-associated peptidyl-prolyl isomerase GldI [Seonamhaeicola marinus]|uniref:Peptidyl-prolyl cis-trans isomerase n=1 Tax=Seonamhaeicola marinus TaxID=1912246 RepID=A0A5D0IKF7_9FLAO|nr:gliding motility-associated peptidyl-prolyl isomerase GldI [Seonamhaeicola marinus]TYA84383.1 gliding motility-associated peptidyl-prolyl isomerase GldI [Seonamhaeicola marinus]
MNKLVPILLVLLVFSCKSPEARRPISSKSGSFINESIARNKALNAKEKAIIEDIMAKNNHDYIASESGFWYFYNAKIEADSLKTPIFGDIVNYNYNVKSLNGNLIYSKEETKTQNYAMDKEELFTGLREGLKLMKTGETVTFLFPSQKAYGYYGDENKIGTNMPIICEVTVNSIIKNPVN